MSKGTKYVAALAIAGGAVYWYDQNVEPIFSKKAVVPEVSHAQKVGNNINQEIDRVGAKSKQLNNKVTNFASEKERELRNQKESTFDSIKNFSFSNKVDEGVDEAHKKFNELKPQERSTFDKLTHKYIDGINSFGESVTGQKSELRSDIRDGHRQVKQEANSWFNWFGNKKDEAARDLDKKYAEAKNDAEQQKNEWFSWGSKKKDEADRKIGQGVDQVKESSSYWSSRASDEAENAKKEFEKSKDGWLSSLTEKKEEAKSGAEDTKNQLARKYQEGVDQASSALGGAKKSLESTLDEGVDKAAENYRIAKKQLDDLTNRANSGVLSLFNKKEPVPDEELKKAQQDFTNALNHLKSYGGDLADQIDKNYYQPLKSNAKRN